MMNGFHNGMDAGWWVLMSVVWIVLIALIVWAAVHLLPGRSAEAPRQSDAERPQEILDRRLARGEIDPDTYDTLRAKLGGVAPSGR